MGGGFDVLLKFYELLRGVNLSEMSFKPIACGLLFASTPNICFITCLFQISLPILLVVQRENS